MKQSKHTPEPWNTDGSMICTDDFETPIATVHGEKWIDAPRIVSCVNACADIPHPEKIPELVEAVGQMAVDLNSWAVGNWKPDRESFASRAKSLRSALRAVKGE